MATGYLTCTSCGAQEKVSRGNRSQTDSYIKWKEERGYLCYSCTKKQREKESQEAAKNNAAAGLPALAGTPKQTTWAETIRAVLLEKYDEMVGSRMKTFSGEITENDKWILEEIRSRAVKHTAASWWIENRFENIMDLFLDTVQEEVKRGDHTAQGQAVLKEFTLMPENPITEFIAEIHIETTPDGSGGAIEVRYPEYNEAVRKSLRKCKFRYIEDNRYQYELRKHWVRIIDTEKHGSVIDRAAEAAHHLVSSGIPVRVYDDEIRQAALDAAYAPEYERWIDISRDNRFCISWGFEDDLYETAKSLPQAKYVKPNVCVPLKYADAVQDFAVAHGFKLTRKALAEIETQGQALIVMEPKPKPEQRYSEPGTKAPATGEIDESLRED